MQVCEAQSWLLSQSAPSSHSGEHVLPGPASVPATPASAFGPASLCPPVPVSGGTTPVSPGRLVLASAMTSGPASVVASSRVPVPTTSVQPVKTGSVNAAATLRQRADARPTKVPEAQSAPS
jgi:hypothetical protein